VHEEAVDGAPAFCPKNNLFYLKTRSGLELLIRNFKIFL